MSAEDIIPTPTNKTGITALKHLSSSEEFNAYLQSLSKITGFDLSIYDENSNLLLTTDENQICKFVKSANHSGTDCPGSCTRFMFESLKSNEPSTFKCSAKITYSSAPIKYLNEKAVIVGRKGFTSYEDFLEFLNIVKDNRIQVIPITTSMNFVGENYIKNTFQYVHQVINYFLNNLQEKHKLTEKLNRFASLVDTSILEKLSKNINSVYRYIIDTIEFILGPTSAAIMALNTHTPTYKAVCAIGKHKDQLMALQFDSKNPVMQEIIISKTPVFVVELESDKLTVPDVVRKNGLLHLFPIFIANTMNGLIVVFDNKLPRENIKIISALRDYIELTLENHAIHLDIDKKLEGILSSISDLSKSIAPLLNWEQLFQTILEKSIQLLKAEQGSLMLLNHETAELMVEAKKGFNDIIKEKIRLHIGEKIAGKVLESGEPLLVEDVEKDPRINQKNRPRYKTKSFVSIPLKIENRVAGVLNISDKITGEVFNENDLKLIQSFTPNAAIAIERSFLFRKIEELKKLSLTDPLTGILNRRYLNSRLSEEISRFKRHKYSFSFLMLDIDGFKKYNDTFGHLTGDKVLKTLTTTITSSIRNIDILTRYGGDEFVVILPQTPKRDAINIANRLKENVAKSHIITQEGLQQNNLTISIGLSSFPEDASSTKELFERTDKALYLAKKEGGNKLVFL